MSEHDDRGHAVLAWTTLAAALAIIAFWSLWFADAGALGQSDPRRRVFEVAFPAADAVLAVALAAAGVLLLRGRSEATFFLAVAAAMALYLGLLDATFALWHGMYRPLSAASVTAILINGTCIAGGAAGLRAAWRMWRTP